MTTPWRAPRVFLLLGLAAAGLASCDSDTVGADVEIDHLETAPLRPFYPVHDTVRAVLVAVETDGTRHPLGQSDWRSLDPTLATVDAGGLIRMLAPGTATVEAEAFGQTIRLQFLIKGLLHFASIHASETWMAVDSPHVVQGYLNVSGPDTAVLTLQPGFRVLFRPQSGLLFGDVEPGRLVTTGGETVQMEGDSAAPGTWIGLEFRGPHRSELRGVSMRHCGGPRHFEAGYGCITATAVAMEAPSLLLEDVTITGARDVGMTLDNFVTFVPGSRNLSIVETGGHIATISPELAGHLPLGGRFEDNVENAIWIATGGVQDSTTWVNPGVPWRLVGQVGVSGPTEPLLTIPAGLRILADPAGVIGVGSNGRGSLSIGGPEGPAVVMESTGEGWGGIGLLGGALPSSLTRVELRDCGEWYGACVVVEGGPLHVEDVTIRDARTVGIRLFGGAPFDSTSRNLTITGSGDVAIEMPADAVPSLPPGDYSLNDRPGIRLRLGQVTRTATWRNPGVPFLAPQGLDIRHPDDGPVLTLEPGVILQLGAGTRIVVAENLWPGALQARGTATEPVLFTSETPGVPGSWMGVELGTGADIRTRLDHVEIRDAGAGDPGGAAAVRLQRDPGGVLRNTRVVRSASCGVVLFSGRWVEDYADPSFGNSFTEVAASPLCTLEP
jgi:hypothetical protein